MNLSGRLARLRGLAQLFVRRKTPLLFGDLTRITPVSHVFGFDRGTPVDRYYIHNFLSAHAGEISGICLEVGEVNYLNLFGKPDIKFMLAPLSPDSTAGEHSRNVWIGDLARSETLPLGRFDCFICTQTLPFIYDFAAAIRGAHALLAPGGLFIGTAGGVSQISRFDMDRWGDYWRFSSRGLTRALQEVFPEVTVQIYGNALAAQLAIQGAAIEDLPDRTMLDPVDAEFEVLLGFTARKSK